RDLRAGGRDHRPGQLLLGGPGRPQGVGRVPGRRHGGFGGRRLVRLPDPAPDADPEAGVEPRRADRSGLPLAVARDPRQRRVRPRLPGPVGGVPGRRRRRPAAPVRLRRGRPRAAARRRRIRLVPRGPSDRAGRMTIMQGSTVALPQPDGSWREIELRPPRDFAEHPEPYRTRVAFAAAHVIADPRGENVPGAPAAVDWEATLAFRRHLFRYGLGVAEAMDTAQRNMG